MSSAPKTLRLSQSEGISSTAQARGGRALVVVPPLKAGVTLGVDGHEAAADLDVLESPPRERRRPEWPAVVAEADRPAAPSHARHPCRGELLAGEAARDGREEPDRYRGHRAARLIGEPLEDHRAVDHGVGVGHREQRHVAAGRRRGRPRGDVPRPRAPACPQRAAISQCDEARQDQHALGVRHDPRALPGCSTLPSSATLPLLREHVLRISMPASNTAARPPFSRASSAAGRCLHHVRSIRTPPRCWTRRCSRRSCGTGSPCARRGR